MINLYYDRITDGLPCPNGTDFISYTKNSYQIPVVKENFRNQLPIIPYTEFYFVMKFTKTPVKLFTGTQKAKNLFYPIELREAHTVKGFGLTSLIKTKVKNKIKKGAYKLLLICNKILHTNYSMNILKEKVKELVDSGISKDNIYILISDVNISYKNFLEMPNVFGIDWQQIYTQIAYKARYENSAIQHHFPLDDTIKYCSQEEASKEKFDLTLWNPTRLYTALTYKQRPWDISLIIELLYQKVDKHGLWFFNKGTFDLPERLGDVIDLKLPMQERAVKQTILSTLETQKLPEVTRDKLKFNNTIYHESLFNIVSDDLAPLNYSSYPNSISVISPGINVWKQIAQGHPFIVLGNLNIMNYLNNQGYFSYNELIYQNYDSITYTPKKVKFIVNEIKKLSEKTPEEIEAIKDNIISFAKKNQEKFYKKDHSRTFWQLFIDMRYEPVV